MPRKKEDGLILILTFIILIAITAIVSAFILMVSIRTKVSGYDISSSKALWLAEAGIQQVLYNLKNNENYRNNPTTVTGNLGSGSYSASVSKDDTTYNITSTGTVDVISRKITQSAVVSMALDRAIHADGAHVKFTDSSGTINGNVSCTTDVMGEGGMTINGTITESPEQENINPSLVLTAYYDRANSLGQVAANKTFTSGTTYNDVWYITNTATVQSNVTISGCIISEHSIQFNGKATNVVINPDLDPDLNGLNYPALYADNDITSTDTGPPSGRIGLQNSTITGLVMSGNNITFIYLKNTTFNGTILADNNITMENSKDGSGGDDFTVTYNSAIFSPMPPGLSFSGSGTVTVSPQKDWNEVVPAL